MSAASTDAWFNRMARLISQNRNGEVISILDRAPSKAKIVDVTGQTLLYVATKYNNLLIMEYLIHLGSDINARDIFGWTPLMVAAKSKDFKSAELLLDYNPDILSTNYYGQNALEIFLNQGFFTCPNITLDMFFKKLKNQIKSNRHLIKVLNKSKCRLDAIIHFRDAELTKQFLALGNHVNYAVSCYSLNVCMEYDDYEENLKVILKYGAGVEFRREVFLDYLREYLNIRNDEISRRKMIRLFIRIIIDLKFSTETTLSLATDLFIYGSEEMCRILFKSGLNSYIKSQFGLEPITYVFGNPNRGVLKLIKSKKIGFNVHGFDAITPLHIAVDRNCEMGIKYLVKMGADVNAIDDNGKPPIYYARNADARSWNIKVVSLLLKHGADIQFCTNDEITFVEYVWHNTDKYLQICLVVWAHLAILQRRKVPIKNSIVTFIQSDKQLREYYQIICQQLDQMKKQEICGSLTLFTVLTKSVDYVSRRVRTLKLHQVKEQYLFENYCLERYHPYFTDLLCDRISKAHSLCRSRERAVTIISDCIQVLKPYYVVVDKICSYLSHDDLRNIAYPRNN